MKRKPMISNLQVKENSLRTLCCLLAIKAGVLLIVILFANIGLGPDEAQYWTWSQKLAFGYYSKPPGIAWQIWLGTQFFDNTEMGVRFGSLLIGTALPLSIFFIGRSLKFKESLAFWAALVFALSPLGIMATFLAITDVGMVFCWSMAVLSVVDHLSRRDSPNYLMIGFWVALGALFKWVMYEFWLAVFVIAAFNPLWRSRKLFLGMILSLGGLLPSLVWNSQHGWPTFRHVGSTIWSREEVDVGTTELIKGNALEFLGAQAILFSPILFFLLLIGGGYLWRTRKKIAPNILFCGVLTFGLLGIYFILSVFKKMQGNWVDFAYPTAAVLTAWFAWEQRKARGWMVAGTLCSVLLCSFVFFIPTVQQNGWMNIPYKLNAFRHNVGWNELRNRLRSLDYDPTKDFLFADKYQMTSILSFYGPGQKRAYFLNLHRIRNNQFTYWPGLSEEQVGNQGFFVVAENWLLTDERWILLENNYKKELSPYFSEVHSMGIYPLFYVDGLAVKGALIFKCIQYNGQEAASSLLF